MRVMAVGHAGDGGRPRGADLLEGERGDLTGQYCLSAAERKRIVLQRASGMPVHIIWDSRHVRFR